MLKPIFPLLAFLSLVSCHRDTTPAPALPPPPVPPAPTAHAKRIYVVLGSSTAEGIGAGPYDSSWVGRSTKYLPVSKVYKNDSIINLARGGYSTHNIIPSGDPARNITKALTYRPYAIIVNMPTNDIANGGTVEQQMKNFATIADLSKQQQVELWVTTAQPRNLNEADRKKLIELNEKVLFTYREHALDFWTDIANADGTIKPMYGSGDGIHLNASAHRLLFDRVRKKVFTE